MNQNNMPNNNNNTGISNGANPTLGQPQAPNSSVNPTISLLQSQTQNSGMNPNMNRPQPQAPNSSVNPTISLLQSQTQNSGTNPAMNRPQPMNDTTEKSPNGPTNQKKYNLINWLSIVLMVGLVVSIGAAIYFAINNRCPEQTKCDVNPEQTKCDVDDNSSENSNVSGSGSNSNNSNSNNSGGGTVSTNTNTTYDKNGAFLMSVDEIRTNQGYTGVTGIISRGTVHVGDTLQIVGLDKTVKTVTVKKILLSSQSVQTANVDNNEVELLLDKVSVSEIERGQVIIAPNSIATSKKFAAEIYVLTQEEGGRHTPFFANYRPQFYFRGASITGTIELPQDVEMVMPGDTVKIKVELAQSAALEVGTTFTIREGGRVVGRGTVTTVY